LRGGSAGRPFLKPFFLIRENFFQSFRTKFPSSFYVISLASKISYCLSVNHNPLLRCVICTGVTLFAPVLQFLHFLHFLHLNCTAVSQSESSNFFMYIINLVLRLQLLVKLLPVRVSDTSPSTTSAARLDSSSIYRSSLWRCLVIFLLLKGLCHGCCFLEN